MSLDIWPFFKVFVLILANVANVDIFMILSSSTWFQSCDIKRAIYNWKIATDKQKLESVADVGCYKINLVDNKEP